MLAHGERRHVLTAVLLRQHRAAVSPGACWQQRSTATATCTERRSRVSPLLPTHPPTHRSPHPLCRCPCAGVHLALQVCTSCRFPATSASGMLPYARSSVSATSSRFFTRPCTRGGRQRSDDRSCAQCQLQKLTARCQQPKLTCSVPFLEPNTAASRLHPNHCQHAHPTP